MRLPQVATAVVAVASAVAIATGAYLFAFSTHPSSAPPSSPEAMIDQADRFAWGSRWADAQPLYAKAEQLLRSEGQLSRALYAQVSQIPADESRSLPGTILSLTQDLARPEAADPETRLRILVIRGMLEINYDAAQAHANWREVELLARSRHHLLLATRAVGEQGIAAFILGDTETAKKQVVLAWCLSKVERDPAATVRYASVFGEGLFQVHRYKEALTPLNEAIKIASEHPEVASPTMAIYAKIDALGGLHRYDEALNLANGSLARLQGTQYNGHKAQVYISRGTIQKDRGDWPDAIADFKQSIFYCRGISDYRGIIDAGGLLAQVYEHTGDYRAALDSINEAIHANIQIPDELYLAPRNLAVKAEILAKLGKMSESDAFYGKSIALVDTMIRHAATTNIERQLLAEMSDIYSGYFSSLAGQKRYDEALRTLERVRGRLEAEALEHHARQSVHPPTPEEQELTKLNIDLINADKPEVRQSLTSAIYNTELQISPSGLTQQTITRPVKLDSLQRTLSQNQLLIEYVVAEPTSFALAVTHSSVAAYPLASKSRLEADVAQYNKELRAQKSDPALAQKLFDELLKPIGAYSQKPDLIIVPDGGLHLLPFAALATGGAYLLATHTIAVQPSSTVFSLLQHRGSRDEATVAMPYVGVAAWTQPADTRNPLLRAITGPQRSQLVALPDSKREVEVIASDLPHPNTILLGTDATEARFKELDLDSTEVIHLALHGYADMDYPDRSALVFAPDPSSKEDGLLQVREIRSLHLNARLVTLSACNTGVGPVGEAGVVNLVNAFIEAGADTVVSTLWELEDQSTEHLMTMFYADLAHHTRKVDALRSAQLDLLNKGLPPYYWASFQIVGEPNSSL